MLCKMLNMSWVAPRWGGEVQPRVEKELAWVPCDPFAMPGSELPGPCTLRWNPYLTLGIVCVQRDAWDDGRVCLTVIW